MVAASGMHQSSLRIARPPQIFELGHLVLWTVRTPQNSLKHKGCGLGHRPFRPDSLNMAGMRLHMKRLAGTLPIWDATVYIE